MNPIEVLGNVLLFTLVFAMSATVDIDCMKEQLRNKKAILLGVFCQFFLLPFLGFATVNLLNLSAPIGITLLVVTSSPGGSYSSWWCSMFNADLALSVTMTAISTILSIVALPMNLLIYANATYDSEIIENLDWGAVFLALGIVIAAIALGLYASYWNHSYRFNMIANQVGNVSGLALIIFSATAANTGEDADAKIWSRSWDFYIGVGLPCILGLLIGTGLTTFLDLAPPERITVSVEACYQNVGIATSMAMTMFDGQELNVAMGVPFFYGVCEAIFVGSYCIVAWKMGWSKAPANAPLWRVITTSYEVLKAEWHEIDVIEIAISSDSCDTSPEKERQIGSVFTTYFEAVEETGNEPKRPSGLASPESHPVGTMI